MRETQREEKQQAGTASGYDAFYESNMRFVDLVNEAVLGGRRFAGEKPKKHTNFSPSKSAPGQRATFPHL
jgi:hypothetical protein